MQRQVRKERTCFLGLKTSDRAVRLHDPKTSQHFNPPWQGHGDIIEGEERRWAHGVRR